MRRLICFFHPLFFSVHFLLKKIKTVKRANHSTHLGRFTITERIKINGKNGIQVDMINSVNNSSQRIKRKNNNKIINERNRSEKKKNEEKYPFLSFLICSSCQHSFEYCLLVTHFIIFSNSK